MYVHPTPSHHLTTTRHGLHGLPQCTQVPARSVLYYTRTCKGYVAWSGSWGHVMHRGRESRSQCNGFPPLFNGGDFILQSNGGMVWQGLRGFIISSLQNRGSFAPYSLGSSSPSAMVIPGSISPSSRLHSSSLKVTQCTSTLQQVLSLNSMEAHGIFNTVLFRSFVVRTYDEFVGDQGMQPGLFHLLLNRPSRLSLKAWIFQRTRWVFHT